MHVIRDEPACCQGLEHVQRVDVEPPAWRQVELTKQRPEFRRMGGPHEDLPPPASTQPLEKGWRWPDQGDGGQVTLTCCRLEQVRDLGSLFFAAQRVLATA